MAKNLAERLAHALEPLALALEPWKARLGKLTLFAGIGMVLLGFPAQIYANWRAQECGIDPVLVGVALVLYVVRIPYTMSVRAWHLLPSLERAMADRRRETSQRIARCLAGCFFLLMTFFDRGTNFSSNRVPSAS